MTTEQKYTVVPDLVGMPLLLSDPSYPNNEVVASRVVDITALRTVDPDRQGLIVYARVARGPIVQFLNCLVVPQIGVRIHYFQRERYEGKDLAYQRALEWFGLTKDELEMIVYLETPYADMLELY